MMDPKKKKRFIVTYTDEKLKPAKAANILGADTKAMRDGVKHLIGEKALKETDILHFENLATSVRSLTEKEAEILRKKDKVAEVVEDIEVFALGDPTQAKNGCPCGDGYGGQSFAALGDPSYLCPPGYRFVVGCVPTEPPPPPPPPPAPPEEVQPFPWNIKMIKADKVWNRVTGDRVKVAVIDTGIDEDHSDLSVSGGASFVSGVSSWDDDNGHGTHCAGIIGARNNPIGVVGVAPRCQLYAVKVLSGSGSGSLSGVLAGMDWAAQNGMHVASMSLGSDVNDPDAQCILAFQRAAQQLIDNGCIVVAAAGNAGQRINHWVGQPARCQGYMAVAAVDKDEKLADFSSNGPDTLCAECGVEISAPGVSVNSTWNDGKYKAISGTSMACPHVSGAAALLKEQHPTWDPAKIRARLKSTARDLGAPGNDPMFGSGLLDCHKAVFG